jgi:hypothetical protein
MSAEVRLEQMLQRGLLPQERNCLVCERPTSGLAYCWTSCERARVEQPTGWELSPWVWVTMLFGFLTLRKVRTERVEGRDLRFRLPLRICVDCGGQLRDIMRLKLTLMEVPVYAELLAKYPDAEVSFDPGLAGVARNARST